MSLTDARIPSVIHELEKRCEPPFSEANFASRAIECIEDCERVIKVLRGVVARHEAARFAVDTELADWMDAHGPGALCGIRKLKKELAETKEGWRLAIKQQQVNVMPETEAAVHIAELEAKVERLIRSRDGWEADAFRYAQNGEHRDAKLKAIEARCRFPDSVGNLREAIQRIISGDSDE